jgi:hypothetical protein
LINAQSSFIYPRNQASADWATSNQKAFYFVTIRFRSQNKTLSIEQETGSAPVDFSAYLIAAKAG